MVKNKMKVFLEEGEITVQHARGILVGCAGAGKTTLLKRLQGRGLQEIEETKSTRGLEVHFHAFEIKNENLEVCTDSKQESLLLGVSTAEIESKNGKAKDVREAIASPESDQGTRNKEQQSTQLTSRFDEAVIDSDDTTLSPFRNVPEYKPTSEQEDPNEQMAGFITDDQIESILTEKEKTFKITMVDIAGQLAYYACHQTYFTDKAFYMLVLDMSQKFDEIVEKKVNQKSVFSTWTYKGKT